MLKISRSCAVCTIYYWWSFRCVMKLDRFTDNGSTHHVPEVSENIICPWANICFAFGDSRIHFQRHCPSIINSFMFNSRLCFRPCFLGLHKIFSVLCCSYQLNIAFELEKNKCCLTVLWKKKNKCCLIVLCYLN